MSEDAYRGVVVVCSLFSCLGLAAAGFAAGVVVRYRRRARAGLVAEARVIAVHPADRPEAAEVLIDTRWLVVAAAVGLSLAAVTSLFCWAATTGRMDGD